MADTPNSNVNVDEENADTTDAREKVDETKDQADAPDAPDAEDLKPTITESNVSGLGDVVEQPDVEQKTAGVHVPTGEEDVDEDGKSKGMKAKRVGFGKKPEDKES